MYRNRYAIYQTSCIDCQRTTTKQYAREHEGKCKSCITGVNQKDAKCPDCGGPIKGWKLRKGYHCDRCTRETDPMGYINEVQGLNDTWD